VVCCVGSQTLGREREIAALQLKRDSFGFLQLMKRCIRGSNVDQPSKQGLAVLSPSEAKPAHVRPCE
jgi:hypothetical protein